MGLKNGEMFREKNQREFDNNDDDFERNYDKENNIKMVIEIGMKGLEEIMEKRDTKKMN